MNPFSPTYLPTRQCFHAAASTDAAVSPGGRRAYADRLRRPSRGHPSVRRCAAAVSAESPAPNETLNVEAGNAVLADLVKRVGGARVDVHTLVPVGKRFTHMAKARHGTACASPRLTF